ncbi:RagB/SusD family nutrient uptake outer membrane protein [uncultured Proteiniphilum sp.]|uniref:RagB/SusD family nutrient uptake outer membrane protein n=1 Tax=uncultured Proteiniphilum sp. TaxID=497637 RepID=UPI00260D6735|nr:RagB/SusD family nutrient uptake outer membrane protein [uncultured Proteiniphilum sp.]
MKNTLKFSICVMILSILCSCNYLNVDSYFEDTFPEDSIFANQVNIQRYFNAAVDYLPREGKIFKGGSTPGVTGSDEAVSVETYSNGVVPVAFPGTELMTDKVSFTTLGGWDWSFNIWGECYKVIRKMNVILSRLDEVEMNSFDRTEFRAKVRFVRAYAYFWLIRNYGPVIILHDEILEVNGSPADYLLTRNTYDECIDYICSELEYAAENLPVKQPIDLIASPTKGAALALVARLRLNAAAPLFNGGDVARRYYGNFTRKMDGVHYISQEYDEKKWAIAALAAKRVMDLNQYELYTVEDGGAYAEKFLPSGVEDYPNGPGGIDPYRSYSDNFTGEAIAANNPELIWGTTDNIEEMTEYVFPNGYGGTNVLCVPQRMIDMYYMADGRDIYNSSALYPYENRPYDRNCVITDPVIISDGFYELPAGVYKSYANREPRFYANISFSGSKWWMSSTTENSRKNIIVDYWRGGNVSMSNPSNGKYNITGYTAKKYVHPRDARSGNGAIRVTKTFPIIRYAEVLLSYAEALNNLTTTHNIDGEEVSRDVEALAGAFNLIRYRAGLPGLTEGELNDRSQLETVIQRERAIELFFEGHRYYDTRRWGIIENLEREPLTGCNVEMGQWNGYYAPTIINYQTIRERNFQPKMILLPISKDELRRVATLDQNPGWEY